MLDNQERFVITFVTSVYFPMKNSYSYFDEYSFLNVHNICYNLCNYHCPIS